MNLLLFSSVNFFLFLFVCGIGAKYNEIFSKSKGIVFRYRDEIRGEKGLLECEDNEVCNIVYDRFWMPLLVERLCKCPNGIECSWSPNRSEYKSASMRMNNRSILKHCNPMENVPVCKQKQTSVMISGKGNANHTYMIPHKVLTMCICPSTHFWRLQANVYDDNDQLHQAFQCLKQWLCETEDFCGYARTDLFSIYYRCTCPSGNLCIFKNKTVFDVQELLYTGPAYKAYCYKQT